MKEFDYGYDICPYCGYDMTKNQEEKWFLPTGTLLANRYTIGVAQSYGGYYINYHGWDQEDTQKVLIREYFPNEGVKRIQGQNELTVYPETFYPQFSKGLDDFLDELKIIKKLPHHEEIFNLKSCFEENFTAYQVMEELEGSTIEDMVKEKGKISIEQSLKLTKTIGAHILKFHSMGVVYGELNPQNIFLCEDGRVKLLPVKSYDYIMSHKIGSQNDVVSTILFPAYTPLELFYDKCMLGPWSDVYALGAVLYYMLTGIEPADAVERFNNETLVSLSRCGINVSEKINRAVQKALSVEPDERYQSMEHFLRELT
jgi:serine/threonine protein kinase